MRALGQQDAWVEEGFLASLGMWFLFGWRLEDRTGANGAPPFAEMAQGEQKAGPIKGCSRREDRGDTGSSVLDPYEEGRNR